MGSLPPPLLRLNEDTFVHLFSLFDARRPSDRTQLAECARVCQTLSPYALQVLWKRLYNLAPLLDVLGDSVKAKKTDRSRLPVVEYTVQEDILAEKWEIFHKYAGFVRYLGVNNSMIKSVIIAPVTFESFASLSERTQQPLFSSLVEFTWSEPKGFSEAFLRFANQLGGVTLDYMRLSSGILPPALLVPYQAALDAIVRKSPYLRRLDLSGFPPGVSLQFLEHCKRLASVHIPYLDPAGLVRAYAGLEGLEVLYLRETRGHLWPPVQGFPALQLAALSADTPNLQRLLSGVTSQHLVGLDINAYGSSRWEEMRRFLATIQTRFSDCLKRISLRGHAYAIREPLRVLDVIAPLLKMRNLEEVTLYFMDSPEPRVGLPGQVAPPEPVPKFALMNSDLADIAGAWPKLRRFTLEAACAPEHAPSVDALSDFARRCSELQHITLDSGYIWSPRSTKIPETAGPAQLEGVIPARHVYSIMLPWGKIVCAGAGDDSHFKCGVFLAALFPYCSWDLCDMRENPRMHTFLKEVQRRQGFGPLPQPEYIAEIMQFRGR